MDNGNQHPGFLLGGMGRWLGILIAALAVTAAATERSKSQRAAFVRENPCQITGKHRGACPGYVVDHIIPLCAGGMDRPSNMQWQSVEEAKAKDREERKMCKAKGQRMDFKDYSANIQGQIDSIALLCSSMAAVLSPATASVLLARCAALREQAAQGVPLAAYEEGFLRIESSVLKSLKQVADAEKIRSLSGDVQH